jgi:hypothetical protein
MTSQIDYYEKIVGNSGREFEEAISDFETVLKGIEDRQERLLKDLDKVS